MYVVCKYDFLNMFSLQLLIFYFKGVFSWITVNFMLGLYTMFSLFFLYFTCRIIIVYRKCLKWIKAIAHQFTEKKLSINMCCINIFLSVIYWLLQRLPTSNFNYCKWLLHIIRIKRLQHRAFCFKVYRFVEDFAHRQNYL